MSPVTRSMTEKARMEAIWNDIDASKTNSYSYIKKEIRLGLSNFERVKGIYSMFEL